MRAFVVAAALAFPLLSPAFAQDPTGIEIIQAALIGAKGEPIGQVTVRGSATATVVRIAVNPGGLPPGWHGLHFHAVGDCSDTGQFQLSKGHVNHVARNHGMLNPDGPDEGDLPNIMVNPDGSANAEVSSLAIRVLGQNGLRDADGSALIIHANEDDHTTQPIGNAGARIACAVLK
jgi:Cu-Zn family superoxide dismutase